LRTLPREARPEIKINRSEIKIKMFVTLETNVD